MFELTVSLQMLVAASIFFVWVVRYPNIVREFEEYGLPCWLRDFVGILKLTFASMLLIGIQHAQMAVIGVGIAVLMAAAFVIHLRAKNPFHKMLPSLSLLLCAAAIAGLNSLFPRG